MAQEVMNRSFQDQWPETSRQFTEALDKLARIETLCLRYNNSSVVTGTHLLANKVLGIVREFKTQE